MVVGHGGHFDRHGGRIGYGGGGCGIHYMLYGMMGGGGYGIDQMFEYKWYHNGNPLGPDH